MNASNVYLRFDTEFYQSILAKIKKKIGFLEIKSPEEFEISFNNILDNFKKVINKQESWLSEINPESLDLMSSDSITSKEEVNILPKIKDNIISERNKNCLVHSRKVIETFENLHPESFASFDQARRDYYDCVMNANKL